MTSPTSGDDLANEIYHLEEQLRAAKLRQSQSPPSPTQHAPLPSPSVSPSLHTLLLLSDSALPLGSFAFSSGLESFLAHHRGPASQQPVLFAHFLRLSILSFASTSLPYVLACHRCPERLADLDNDFDASTMCTVARRASVAQGRALLGVWERSFRGQGTPDSSAATELKSFSRTLRTQTSTLSAADLLNAHLAPLWGVVTRALGVDLGSAAYMFLFGHARAVVSAGVRASVLGPYQAQAELASGELREAVGKAVSEWWDVAPEEAGQTVPVVDLWVGRHEKLYSRIFNS